jgi:hypothetical protein
VIAALYVETNGVYYGLDSVDPWDEQRDARLYAGPWPVVAHPPCARWSVLAPLVESQTGYKVGDDGGTFAAALDAVLTYGGVIEHPAYSFAWSAFKLPMPIRYGWQSALGDPGWSTEVSQVAYGHPCRKRTWLYYVGETPPPAMDWSEPPVLSVVSDLGPGGSRRRGEEWEPGTQYDQASRSPLAFRDSLIDLAYTAGGMRAIASA